MKFIVLCCLLVSEWLNVEARNPMMNPGMFEGDMLDVPLDADRNAIPSDSQRWPDGVIPYIIDPSITGNHLKVLHASIDYLERVTCISFVPWTVEDDYVKVYYGTGCFAHWGRLGIGEQELSLGDRCDFLGTGIHEWMHAIGFEHEHNRSDRDGYVTILWQNIPKDWQDAFLKLKPSENRLLTPFDYDSIMLYGSGGLDDDHPENLSMLKKDGGLIPEVYDKREMSKSDIRRVKMLYKC